MNSIMPSRHRWSKLKAIVAIVCVLIIIAGSGGFLIWWHILDFDYLMAEARALFDPKDITRIYIDEWYYARQGIVLNVYAPAGVAEVWKLDQGPPWGRWRWPWDTHYYMLPFRLIEGDDAWHTIVLVDWPFNPGTEWGLNIRSQDGYWTSESPFMHSRPDLRDEQWNELVAKSRVVVPGH